MYNSINISLSVLSLTPISTSLPWSDLPVIYLLFDDVPTFQSEAVSCFILCYALVMSVGIDETVQLSVLGNWETDMINHTSDTVHLFYYTL